MCCEAARETVLVTGASGFVGRAVTGELARAGHRVVALARFESRAPAELWAGVAIERGDVRDPEALARAFAHRPSAVVHLVGLAIHVEATQAVLAAAQLHGARRFVHVSALGARPHPAIRYHRHKWTAEERVRAAAVDHTILKPSVIFGPECDFLNSLEAIVRLAGVTPVVGARARLQPVFVGDVAQVVARCLARRETIGQCFELGGPEVVALGGIVSQLEARLGRRKPRLELPLWMGRLAASAPVRPLIGAVLGSLGLSVHPERWLNQSHIELLTEDNVCSAPLSPLVADLCRTPLSTWLARGRVGEVGS